ncbi:hypothetical protein CDL15_Pgr024264 [Punica granatum]|uniref:Uncharacterized protein n=1 Tax=Punica granatum TaxID=22663 RepID=A0A218XXZ1_PUNGR|nr:hypothetical protein CDL15_Pgr024264 [Punica granatum]
MESLSPVSSSSSIVLPPSNPPLHLPRPRVSLSTSAMHSSFIPRLASSLFSVPLAPDSPRKRLPEVCCKSSRRSVGGEEDDGREEEEEEEVERALHLDGSIPGTSDEFVKRVSSRAYDMRRHLEQSFDSSSYDDSDSSVYVVARISHLAEARSHALQNDFSVRAIAVLEANPWRDSSKPVYVLTHGQNQLCTMKTRRNRSEVERELGMLFSKARKWSSGTGNQNKQSRSGTKFQMLVEDIREGVLVFEDENEAAKYCDLLQGGGQGCEGVAEIEASSVFDLCSKMRALAVLFRRGRTPPLPQSLELNLRAKKRSLED